MNLSKIDTDAPKGLDKKEIEEKTLEMAKEIAELQEALYAEAKQSLLIIFQGMDASGKDGTTKAAFGQCTPIGVSAYCFKKPTPEEFAHDFLWRAHRVAPAKGAIQVFIRSYYEDVLIQRVHSWIDEKRVKSRMAAINAFEKTLMEDNNTTILKFYLHISEERQEEKLQERIDIPEKNYKHNAQDWEERKLWKEYMSAYTDAMETCNSPEWIIVPADQRWYRNYFATKTILETLKKMNPQYPVLKKEDVGK
jgi:PPK2 family polyphosphate:nucleotide phosphotransferase